MQGGEDEDTKTTIDWDAELKKLNSKQVRGVSDTEVAVENFKKKVDAKLSSTLNNVQPIRVPNPKSMGRQLLAKDWKFWALVLAGVGFAAALSGALSREELVVLEDTHNMERVLAAASFDFSSGGGAGAAAGDALQQLVA